MVDEMDLLTGMKDAEPVRPSAFEDARATLRAAMAVEAVPQTKTALRRRVRWGTGRVAGLSAVALGAAAAAVGLVVTSTPAPGHSAAPTGSPSRAQAASSPLVTLAALITASSGPLPGNASLIIRTQTEGGIPPQVSYNLYTDSGAFYVGGDKASLRQAIRLDQNMADGITAQEVKAALYAAAGNLATARVQMVDASSNALGLGLPLAERKAIWAKAMAADAKLFKEKGIKAPLPLPTGKTLRQDADNAVWNNSVDALSAGAGNPKVRAGVLRLLSTISGVTVARSTAGGQPTLVLTAGPEVFGGLGEQVLTINARTGMPIKSVQPAFGKVPSSADTYQVRRVTLNDIDAGRF
jgi:hypothetical protein